MSKRANWILLFGFAIALLSTVAWLGWRHIARMRETAEWVAHTHEVQANRNRLLALVLEIESDQRSYILTGLPAFLNEFEEAAVRLPQEEKKLEELTRDEMQKAALSALKPLMAERIAFARRTLELRRNSGAETAAREIATLKGKKLTDEIRARFVQMDARGEELLRERTAAARAQARNTTLLTATGTGLSFALLISVFALMLRETRLRQLAELSLAQSNEKLEERVRERNRIMEAITSDVPLSAILELIVRAVETEDPGAVASVLLLDAEEKHLLLGAAPGLPEFYNRAVHGLAIGPEIGSCGAAAYTKRCVIAGNLLTHPNWTAFRELVLKVGLRSCWSEPILSSAGAVLGTFAIYHRTPGEPGPAELERIKSSADLARLAIERARAAEEIRALNAGLEQKVAERTASLAASEERFRAVAEGLGEGLLLTELNDRVLDMNPRMLEFTGFSRAELLGQIACELLMPPEEREKLKARNRDRAAGKSETYTTELLRKDGTRFWATVTASPLRAPDGQVIGTIGAVTDVTERKRAELALHESEERLRLALEAAQMGSYDWDIPRNHIVWSRRHEALWGYKPGEFSGTYEGFSERVHPDDLPVVNAAVALDINNRSPFRREFRVVWPDKSEHWIESSGEFTFDEAGKAVRMRGAVIETTERKRAQEELDRFFMLSLDMMAVASADGYFKRASPGFTLTLGWSMEEMLARPFMEFVHPDDRAATLREVERLVVAGEKVLGFENRYLHKDGSWRVVAWKAVPQPGGLIYCSGRDVTDLKQAETALRERAHLAEFQAEIGRAIAEHHELQPLLQECAAAMVGTFDAAFVRIWTLNEAEQILELRASAGQYTHLDGPHGRVPVGKFKIGLIASERLPHLTNNVLGDPRVGDQDWARREGMEAFAGYPLLADGRLVGVVAMFARHKLTEGVLVTLRSVANTVALGILARQAEDELRRADQTLRTALAELSCTNAELDEASRHKDEFLANMSHELRTPLNAILGLSEALLEQTNATLTPRQVKSVTTISTSGAHLLALINDILDLSKIEAGKLELHAEPLKVDEFCQSCLVFVKTQAMLKQIGVAFEHDGRAALVTADPKRLKQILVNLLTNAVKFTRQGGRIGLSVAAPEGEDVMRFTVWDTGIGIAQADQAKLFRAFTQVDSGLNRLQEGTGLGLALVARLVELHGGSVSLESEPGKGSRFIVTLPLPAGGAAVPLAAASPANAGGTDFPRRNGTGAAYHPEAAPSPQTFRRALVIEDDPTAGEQLVDHLTLLGLTSALHVRGAESIEAALREKPDLILLDILLPDESGWVVLAKLKEHPGTRDIPVVVVSVVDEPQKSLSMGAAAHFTKPFTRDQIAGFLRRPFTPTPQPATRRVPQTEACGPAILLAEDNEANIQTLGGYLEDKGYAMRYAKHGLEAVRLARELRPALILMDIQMPVMDGLTAIREIRADAALKAIPIVALTALAMPGDRERCLATGATEYMSKPVSLKSLAELVGRLLQARKVPTHSL